MHKIVKLWVVPRSTSTAFEWMMRQRGDMTCFHEPFSEVWYQGEQPDWPRYVAGESVRTPGLTYDSALASLLDAARTKPVFSKDMAMCVTGLWSKEFLAQFTNSFLIRDPAKSISSVIKHWPDVHPLEIGNAQQRALFDRVADLFGAPPPVMDSDDLLADPERLVLAYCDAVGIPFVPDALRWSPGARDEVSWWDGGSFHENLRNSDGLKPQPRRHADLSQAPDRAKRLYEAALPHYEYLKRFRLGQSADLDGHAASAM